MIEYMTSRVNMIL